MSLKPLLSEVFDFFSFALDAGEKPVFSFTVATVIDRAQQIGMNEIVHASSPFLRKIFPTTIKGLYSAAVDKIAACTCSKLGNFPH